jgi:hypothetical protein
MFKMAVFYIHYTHKLMPVKIRTMNGVYNSTMSEIYYLRIK